jgi:hypothetical protein
VAAPRLSFAKTTGEPITKIEFKPGEIIHDFFDGDVKQALRTIARAELQEQIDLGNTNFIVKVDGRQNVPLERAEAKVEVNFLNESLSFALEYIYGVMYRAAYDRAFGVHYGSGRLGTNVKSYLNGYPVSVGSIKTFGINDRVVFWYMQKYAHSASRRIYARHHISLVSRVARILQRDGRFRGLTFRALDMRADLGDGNGRIRRVGVLIKLDARLRELPPGSRGRIF